MGAPSIKRPGALGVRHGGPPFGGALGKSLGGLFGLGSFGTGSNAPLLTAAQIKVPGA
jgi:hypothetical protein